MEDRKRPSAPDDANPPAKRQAVAVNGARPHQVDADLPWKDDIEAYQKDAIMRQMREYKREKTLIEAQLGDLQERSRHHDAHLRTIDIWFDQLVDEIRILSDEQVDSVGTTTSSPSIPPTLFFADNDKLRAHLEGRKDRIISALSGLFAKFPNSSPEVSSLQEQIARLLATEKEHVCELQRVMTESEQVAERLVTATRRYMVAEKKNDRLRSAQVQKLESQAISSNAPAKESTPATTTDVEHTNGIPSGDLAEEIESARDRAIAEATRRKEHAEQMEAENKKLTEEISALNTKLTGLSDDDYAKTELFKAIKSQHEDVIKRINNLEATNIQLREEAQKYQAERTAYRMKVDEEARNMVSETESAVVQAETNLTRIRHSRDELLAKVSILEGTHKDVEVSKQQTKDLMSSCESRIEALESECTRLRLQITEQEQADGEVDPEGQMTEQLRSRVQVLESQQKLLSDELPAMEAAWKKAQAAASKKIKELATWEETVSRATADKAKADQKFFAAMKAKETLEQQLRVLRAQATKGTEIVAQLKEADSLSRSLVDKLEKQTAELRAQMEELSTQHRQLQQKTNESAIVTEGHVSQIAELKKVVESKDTVCLAAKKAQRESEVERDDMSVQVKALEKQLDHWKQKSMGNQSEHASLMESMLQCQICKNKVKDTVIKTCGHVFCDQCVQDRLINRSRKCPSCGKAFGNNDTMRIHF